MNFKTFTVPDIAEGQTLFCIVRDKIRPLNFTCWVIKGNHICGHLWNNGFNWGFAPKDIGKTVFLTQEDAEQVLSEVKAL